MNSDFEQIVRDYQRPLLDFARRIVHNREDAEEIVQDAFVRAYRALSDMLASKRDAIHLNSWLHTITLNVARNRLRKKHHQVLPLDAMDPNGLLPVAQTSVTPESALDKWLDHEFVAGAILKVPPNLQATARLRFLDGLTHAEIAERFCEPVGTIRSRVFRAARRIRNILATRSDAA